MAIGAISLTPSQGIQALDAIDFATGRIEGGAERRDEKLSFLSSLLGVDVTGLSDEALGDLYNNIEGAYHTGSHQSLEALKDTFNPDFAAGRDPSDVDAARATARGVFAEFNGGDPGGWSRADEVINSVTSKPDDHQDDQQQPPGTQQAGND